MFVYSSLSYPLNAILNTNGSGLHIFYCDSAKQQMETISDMVHHICILSLWSVLTLILIIFMHIIVSLAGKSVSLAGGELRPGHTAEKEKQLQARQDAVHSRHNRVCHML